jgi:hypothetical protein
MAGMAAPVTVAAVDVRVDKDDLGGAGGAVHQANKVGEDSPLRKLDGEVQNAVAGGRESPVAATGVAKDPAKRGEVLSNGLNRDQAGAAGHTDRQDGLLNGPTIDKAASGGGPRDARLEPLKGDQILVLFEEFEAQQLGSRDHEDVGHSSGRNPQVLKDKIIPLLAGSGKADSTQVNQDRMPLKMGEVIQAVIGRRRLGPHRGPAASTNGVRKRHLGHDH